jgi:hypothetical protein
VFVINVKVRLLIPNTTQVEMPNIGKITETKNKKKIGREEKETIE